MVLSIDVQNVVEDEMKKDGNQICMLSDDNYAMYTGVALTSLKLNKNVNSKYIINILSDGISKDNQTRLLSLQSENFIIKILEVTGFEDIKKDMVIKNLPATPTALYKFRIPYYFNDLDSILYVDGDVIFYQDIEKLFDFDVKDYYAAVTTEFLPNGEVPYDSKRIGVDHKVYFNSGLMLMNLKKFREDSIPEKLIAYRKNGINKFMDQDAFNAIIGNNVLCFPMYFFTPYFTLKDKRVYAFYDEKTKNAIIKKTLIMHLAYLKPWNRKMRFITKQYLYYHSLSPFKDVEIRPESYYKQYRRRIKKTKLYRLCRETYRNIKSR